MEDEVVTVSGFEQGTFEYRVANKAKIYLGEEPSALAVDFALKKFKDRINFPHGFTQEQISMVMENNLAAIAMAVADLEAKVGGEGETGHTDSGTTRQYENAYISLSIFSDIISYADTPF